MINFKYFREKECATAEWLQAVAREDPHSMKFSTNPSFTKIAWGEGGYGVYIAFQSLRQNMDERAEGKAEIENSRQSWEAIKR